MQQNYHGLDSELKRGQLNQPHRILTRAKFFSSKYFFSEPIFWHEQLLSKKTTTKTYQKAKFFQESSCFFFNPQWLLRQKEWFIKILTLKIWLQLSLVRTILYELLDSSIQKNLDFQAVNPAAYQYQWEVSDPTGNNFYGAGEKREDSFTSGSYFVLLPDGRRQRVDYTVNGAEGYVATVTYD